MIMKVVKRVISSSFLLYAFNMILVNFNVVIPLNLWTICFVSFFDIPGIIILLVLKAIGV